MPPSIVIFVPASARPTDVRAIAILAMIYAVSGGMPPRALRETRIRPIVVGEDQAAKDRRSRRILNIHEPNPDLRRIPPKTLGRADYRAPIYRPAR